MRYVSKQQGFTLTEILVGMGILAILALLAIPSYQNYVKEARLKDAQAALLKNARHLENMYSQQMSFKKNSTTWLDLPETQTAHFCIKMQGNPRGAANDKFTIKAVALNKKNEPRVLTLNQDNMMMLCESSTSICESKNAFFTNSGRSDTNCQVIN